MKPQPAPTDVDLFALESERFRLDKLLKKWQRYALAIKDLDTARDLSLQPHRDRFDKVAEPIVAEFEAELAPLRATLEEIENEISIGLLKQIASDGTIGIQQLAQKHALAEVTVDEKREISPAEFFAAVHAADRHSKFWACLRVLIGEASKYLPKETMTRLAKFNRTHAITIRLK